MTERTQEPTVEEIEGSESPDLAVVPVQVEGPVRVQQLPAVSGEMSSRNDITVTPQKLFSEDPRRKVLTLIANTAPLVIGRTQQECLNGAHIPTNIPVVITHREAVWI